MFCKIDIHNLCVCARQVGMTESLPTTTNLLLKFLGTVQHFNLFLSSDKSLLVIILLVRPTKDALRPRRIDSLLLQSCIIGVVKTVSW